MTGSDASSIQAGLPTVNTDWKYRTFRSPGGIVADSKEFMRVRIETIMP